MNDSFYSLNARQSLRGVGHLDGTSMMVVSKAPPRSAILFAEPVETPTTSDDLESTRNTGSVSRVLLTFHHEYHTKV